MRISGGGSPNVNLLLSDAAQFRNEDFVVSQNASFAGSQSLTAAGGQFAHHQIFNPAGSGITLMVDKILVSSPSNDSYRVARFNTELTTDGGAWVSFLSGGAAGASHIRRESNASQLGTIVEHAQLLALTPWTDELLYPYQLAAGQGLLVGASTVAQTLFTTFYGREV